MVKGAFMIPAERNIMNLCIIFATRFTLMEFLFVLAILSLFPISSPGASIGIWPAERQKENIYYCYGGDLNVVTFPLRPDNYSAHQLLLPAKFSESSRLELSLPDQVKFIAATGPLVSSTSSEIQRSNAGNALKQIVTIPLDNKMLNSRLLDNQYITYTYIWFKSPKVMEGQINYRLFHGDALLAQGLCNLKTAGTLDGDKPMPKKFGFYTYSLEADLPKGYQDYFADFNKRLGLTGMLTSFARADSAENRQMFEANTRHGIKNIAALYDFIVKHAKGFKAPMEETLKRGGLVPVMDEICESLNSVEAHADWAKVQKKFDKAFCNWEPTGPNRWPGYNDPATILAFKKQQGIQVDLTEEVIKTHYRDLYERFRMEQIARPIVALSNMIKSANPAMPFGVIAGSGLSRPVDYRIYNAVADTHSPMIYQPTPLRYARNLLAMLKSTQVPADKFWPVISVGWPQAGVHRKSPRELLLDTVVTAAAGCSGISHWPTVHREDALLYGIYQGLSLIAPVEDFFLDGESISDISISGLPYEEEKVRLGSGDLLMLHPNWQLNLIHFAHKLHDEYVITLLNYDHSESAFVEIHSPEINHYYLINQQSKSYQTVDSQGKAIVHVAAQSPEIWLATSNKEKTSGYKFIDANEVETDFQSARADFLKKKKAGAIAMGTKGKLSVSYALHKFDANNEQLCLQVETPEQKFMLDANGGRIINWTVSGTENFVTDNRLGLGGICKDLFWLPDNARWSGDESQQYTLMSVDNDGKRVKVVYEVGLKKALSGISIEKTYTVPVDGTNVNINIILRNDNVDSAPMISYWSHNMINGKGAFFVGKDFAYETKPAKDTVFVAEKLDSELQNKIIASDKIAGKTENVYAEFLPDKKLGIIFQLPANFMNIYRWASKEKEKDVRSSEWMTKPILLEAGGSKSFDFTISVKSNTNIKDLQSELKTSRTPGNKNDGNLFPVNFNNLNKQSLPDGLKILPGKNSESSEITMAMDESGVPSIKVQLQQPAAVSLLSPSVNLSPDGQYVLICRFKVENMHYSGSWYKDKKGIWILIKGLKFHTWMAITGTGSSDGWITAILPFAGSDEKRDFSKIQVFLRCLGMTGTVSFNQPVLVKKPDSVGMEEYFESDNGKKIKGTFVSLDELSL